MLEGSTSAIYAGRAQSVETESPKGSLKSGLRAATLRFARSGLAEVRGLRQGRWRVHPTLIYIANAGRVEPGTAWKVRIETRERVHEGILLRQGRWVSLRYAPLLSTSDMLRYEKRVPELPFDKLRTPLNRRWWG